MPPLPGCAPGAHVGRHGGACCWNVAGRWQESRALRRATRWDTLGWTWSGSGPEGGVGVGSKSGSSRQVCEEYQVAAASERGGRRGVVHHRRVVPRRAVRPWRQFVRRPLLLRVRVEVPCELVRRHTHTHMHAGGGTHSHRPPPPQNRCGRRWRWQRRRRRRAAATTGRSGGALPAVATGATGSQG